MGARQPEAPTIYPHATKISKFQAGSLNGHLKLMIIRLTSSEQTTKFAAHSALLKWQWKMFDHQPHAK